METQTAEQLKEVVRKTYSQIAEQERDENASSCCGATGCATVDSAIMAEDYTNLKGYSADADLGLGCGLPTEFAQIKEGNTVVDLGSGAGNDAFVARSIVGDKGKVIGIDFTEKMIAKARINADKLGFNNVEFRYGDIEEMPLGGNMADVVVSNCVLNLVPDKKKAFTEIYRVLKPGGHFSVSDIVLMGELPEGVKRDAQMYAGCVSGAIQKEDYLRMIKAAGFTNAKIQKEKPITIPDEILNAYLSKEELAEFKSGKTGIFSITVYAEKEGVKSALKAEAKAACCGPDCCN
jgi:arsenite methyltransferase